MRKQTLLIFSVVLVAALCAMFMAYVPHVKAAGPYLIVGTVNNTDNSVPADNDVTFKTYISTRTGEILTQASNGCGYGSGLYSVEVGNFPTAWSVGDILVVEIINLNALQAKTIQIALAGDFSENANVVLDYITPQTVTIAPVDPTVQVPATQQFTATATFEGIAGGQDVTNSATWASSNTTAGTINAAGLFTPYKTGTTDITATLSGVTSDASTVTVTAKEQFVNLIPDTTSPALGTDVQLTVNYDVSAIGSNQVNILDMTVHFDSSKFTYLGYTDFLDVGDILIKPETAAVVDDTTNDDNDTTTDKKIPLRWLSFTAVWPNVDLPTVLSKLNFTTKTDAALGAANFNIHVNEAANGYVATVANATVTVVNKMLDSITIETVAGGTATGTFLLTGQSVQFRAVGHYKLPGEEVDPLLDMDITGTVNWNSSTAATGTLDAAGLFTSLAAGTSSVTAVLGAVSSNAIDLRIADPITVAGPAILDSGATAIYTAAGGTGAYVWEATDGAIANGEFTAPVVAAGNTVVTIKAYDATYNKDSATPVFGQIVVTVFAPATMVETPADYDPTKPETYPLMALGAMTTLTAKDPNRNYTWEIKDWTGASIETYTGTTISIYPDTLLGASGAGVYTVYMTDQTNPTLAPAQIMIRVPMRITTDRFGIVAGGGTYYSNQGMDTFTVTGGPAAIDVYNYEALDMAGAAVTAEHCGALVDASPTDATNDFAFTAGIPKAISFRVKVTLDAASNDADVARLIAAGLDEVWSGIFTVIPKTTVSGTVVNAADGATPVAVATVTATHDPAITTTTDATGAFTIANFDNAGAAYSFYIEKTGFIPKTYAMTDILAGPVHLEALAAGSAGISGTALHAWNTGPVTVKGKTATDTYVTDTAGAAIEVLCNPEDGTYQFPIPAAVLTEGPFTLEFRAPGYIFYDADPTLELGVLTGIEAGTAGADITLHFVTNFRIAGTPINPDEDGNFQDVRVDVWTISPSNVFNGTAGEIEVAYSDGTPVTDITFAYGVWSFIHEGYENFTVTVKADTSETMRDTTTGYYKARVWEYVKSSTEPLVLPIIDPTLFGFWAVSPSGNIFVTLVPGESFVGAPPKVVTLSLVEADASEAGAAMIKGSEIFSAGLFDASGDPIKNEDIGRIVIAIKFDPTVVTPGALESGAYHIYQAPTMRDLIAGAMTAVPVSQIIQPVDYTNGIVTFWVNQLGAFGMSDLVLPMLSGRVVGAVAGYADLPVREAHVTLIAEGTGETYATVTNDDGSFSMQGVPAGNYTMTVTAPGIYTYTQDVTIDEGQYLNLGTLPEVQGVDVESMYSQEELDQAVADANAAKDVIIAEKEGIIASMFTQEQLDQAVADANAAKDVIIAEKEGIIASMFTQEELDQAVADANAVKDAIITEKDVIIGEKDQAITDLNATMDSMFTQDELNQVIAAWDIDGDGKIGLADIIHYLQIISGVVPETTTP